MAKRGPQLPGQLLEELGLGSASQSARNGRGKLSRKDERRQDRQDRKTRKAEHHTRPKATATPQSANVKRVAAPEPAPSPPRKKARLSDPTPPKATTARPSEPKSTKSVARPPKTALAKLAERPQKAAPPPRSDREKQEDAYIAYLEGKLGWKKGKEKTKSYGSGLDEDGLDDLLEGLDEFGGPDTHTLMDTGDGDSEEEEEEDELEEMEDAAEDDVEEWAGVTSAADEPQPEPEQPATSSVSTTNRYVPPALRNKAPATADSEEIVKLKRQIKGLLNRLSEQNIGSIVESIEELYRSNRRNDVSSNLTSLLIEGISLHAVLLDSHVALIAAFVTAMFKIIGQDFGANFVQQVVTSYDRHREQRKTSVDSSTDEESAGGKESSNLVVLLTELYNFQLVSCVLMYDIVRELLDGGLEEFDVELLSKIMRNCGNQLRQDDPSALKDIVQIVQTRVSGQENASSRTRFMLETLVNLKNNRLKKTGNAGQTGGNEAVERMKKFLTGLEKKRHVLAHEPIRVSLTDLRSADTKGKWWIVGAAWGGDPLVERQDRIQREEAKPAASFENALLKLAKKQGMNTDIRRSIFVVLMSSEDYVDASDRLSQLNLTEIQQREIIRVILHCCGNEKAYNPYYALITQHLCANSHSYKITLQFSLWDFLRDLGEKNVGGAEVVKNLEDGDEGDFGNGKKITEHRIRNVARLYAWLIAKNRLTLAILKPVDFTTVKSQSRLFFTEFFKQTFFSSHLANPSANPEKATMPAFDRMAIEEVFIKAVKLPAVATGIVFFLSKHVAPHTEEGAGENFASRACEVAMDTLRTGLDVGSFL